MFRRQAGNRKITGLLDETLKRIYPVTVGVGTMKNSQKGRKHGSEFDLKNFTGNDDVSILANDTLLGHKTNKRTNNNIIIKACKEKKNLPETRSWSDPPESNPSLYSFLFYTWTEICNDEP